MVGDAMIDMDRDEELTESGEQFDGVAAGGRDTDAAVTTYGFPGGDGEQDGRAQRKSTATATLPVDMIDEVWQDAVPHSTELPVAETD
jgi:hypothetical protein